MRVASILAALLLTACGAWAQTSEAAMTEQTSRPELKDLFDRFAKSFYDFQPSAATRAGLHAYDAQMEDFSAARVSRQIVAYQAFSRECSTMSVQGWSLWTRHDKTMLCAFIDSRIAELSDAGTPFWKMNPDFYSSLASDSAFVLMGRNYGRPEDRLRALIARERRLPALFADAKKNLNNPPRIFTEVAIEQLPGIAAFFERDAPLAFAGVKDERLQAELRETTRAVVSALNDYAAWLKSDLLPRSNGDYRLGAKKLAAKLHNEELVDAPLDELLERGEANLRANQQEFARVARLIDPNRTPQQILVDLQKEHPSSGELIPAFAERVAESRRFVAERRIMTSPGESLPKIEETPAFMRALTSASMDAPGPFEQQANEAFFNVTLPEPTATPAETEEFLRGFSRGVIVSTAIHEVIPGHYEQYLWNERVPSRIRQFLSLDLSNIGSHFAGTNVEGWAHYTEQMMIDEGFGRTPGIPEQSDQAWLKLRLGQLQDALLRNARYVVAIRMHAGGMSFEEAVKFFQKEGYQTRPTALMEARRGCSDPTYLMYTLGKLQILELRRQMEIKLGPKFSLQAFHDELMRQGVAPWSLVSESMLGVKMQ